MRHLMIFSEAAWSEEPGGFVLQKKLV